MAESTRVRLVRCPKCENLLPELSDFAVYQCGGCYAVLRAKNKTLEVDSLSGKSKEERVARSSNVSKKPLEKEMEESGGASDTDVKSTAGSLMREEKGLLEKDDIGKPTGKDHEDSNSQSGKMPVDNLEPNYYSDSSSGTHKPLRNSNNQGGSNNTGHYLDQDRDELLRKLDEVREQLIKSSNVAYKPKESDQPPIPFFGPDKHIPGPSYFHHYPEPFPYASGNQIPVHGLYPSSSHPTRLPGYDSPFGLQMQGRVRPNWLPGQYPNQPARQYFPGQYVDIGPDIFEPHPQDSMFPPYFPVPPSRFGDVPYSPVSYHHEKIGPFSSHNYTRTSAPSSMSSSGPQAHTRWPSDLDSDVGVGGFAHWSAPKAVSASGARRCHPLAGGAPFIACKNCFELLQIPKKARSLLDKQQKLQCGACSEVINFAIDNKKLFLSSGHEDTNPVSGEVNGNSSVEDVKDTTSNSYTHVNRSSGNFSSVDYDNSGYDFHYMDKEPMEVSRTPRDMQSYKSSSSSDHSEDENDFDTSSAHKKMANSVQRPTKDAKVSQPPPSGASLQELFDYSTTNRAALSYGMANLGFHSNKEYMIQNSLKEGSVVTETDVSFNGYSHTEVSEDSRDGTIRDDDRPRSKKGGDSGFVDILKRSFRSQNEERGKCEVWVNGHLIAEDSVKNAEIVAGPIQPGNYWYDYRAGFWGVMGKPCLGIILPFVEELNYPMPEHCAGGNTGVFVNGRELHQRDLDLLAGRGLPTDKNRSYIVDISGRVLDGDTGEELDRLGRLAPTLEKLKRGFGMRVPRAAS